MVYDSYEFGKYLTELRRKYNVSMNVYVTVFATKVL